MKHEQKSTELEEFLEQEIKKLEHESSQSKDDSDQSDIIWDAAEAAVALGKAKNVEEVANAVMNSEAFAHLTDEVVAVIKRAAPEEKAAEGMVGDFQADSALAIEFEEGDGSSGPSAGPGADEEAEEGYLFSAVSPKTALHAEEDEAIFGGGKPPSDDDENTDRGKREPKAKKARKSKAEGAEAEVKPKPRAKSKSGGKGKGKKD